MNIAIGGYFELELNQKKDLHKKALHLNTGRNCFEYILVARKYEKVYLPYYCCNALLEPLIKLDVRYEFYSINKYFEPEFEKKIGIREAFLYINYFGLKQDIVLKLSKTTKNLIIDNTQAYFSKPVKNIDTFYSTRKFFGLPDGGILYTDKLLEQQMEQDISYPRMEHLLLKIDKNTEEGYTKYLANEELLNNQPIRKMSKISHRLLKNINYAKIEKKRNKNFLYLHKKLKTINKLSINIKRLNGPMIYPLLCKKEGIRQFLIENKVYNATYWKEVLERVESNTFEATLTKNLIALPVDQRNNFEMLKFISGKVLGYK